MYGINVKFYEYGAFSTKTYTYLSEIPYEKGQALVVPVGKWYGVVKVHQCVENPQLRKDVSYKHVLAPLELYTEG